jgi:hypothetical protein
VRLLSLFICITFKLNFLKYILSLQDGNRNESLSVLIETVNDTKIREVAVV